MNPSIINVCIAEDHLLVRKAFIDMINDFSGFEVVMEAGNGIELLEQLESSQSIPDIAIIDINMKKMNGYELCKQLRNTYEQIKVLVLTMFENEMAIVKMIKLGANGYLLKDTHPDEFERALGELANKGEYFSELTSSVMAKSLRGNELGQTVELNERENTFLRYTATELTYKEIAREMEYSERTIDSFREALFTKLGVKSRIGLVLFAIRSGLVEI